MVPSQSIAHARPPLSTVIPTAPFAPRADSETHQTKGQVIYETVNVNCKPKPATFALNNKKTQHTHAHSERSDTNTLGA